MRSRGVAWGRKLRVSPSPYEILGVGEDGVLPGVA